MRVWEPIVGVFRSIGLAPPRELLADEPLHIDELGWLDGERVERIPAHESWYYPNLTTPYSEPIAVIWHYTATNGGLRSMAKRRRRKRKKGQRAASWHVTIGRGGEIVQLVSLEAGAWHCRTGTIADDEGHRHRVNRSAIGVELIGHGDTFTELQVAAARRLLLALAYDYGIPRERAGYQHSHFDPLRRSDAGELWEHGLLPELLDDVYGALSRVSPTVIT